MKVLNITLVVLITAGLGGCFLATAGLHAKPGYADMALPSFGSVDKRFGLSLGPMALKPVRWALSASGEAGMEIFDDIQGIRLRIYDATERRDPLEQALEKSMRQLKASGWQLIVAVNEAHERVLVMVNETEEHIDGVLAIVIGHEQAVFVNVLGEFKPENIARFVEKVRSEST